MSELTGFVAVSLVIIVVPGPDLALLLANTARSGRRAGIATAAGIMLGNAVLAAAAVAGLTALLTASELGYAALRSAGAVYLAYLGIQALAESSACAETVSRMPGRTAILQRAAHASPSGRDWSATS